MVERRSAIRAAVIWDTLRRVLQSRQDAVRALDELQKKLAALGLAHVERDAALTAIGVLERERRLALRGRAIPVVVARPGHLDLDHVGAEVGERGRRKRTRHHAREIEDADAREHAARHGRRR